MFPVKNRIGEDIKNLRKELKLSKTKLSQLSKVSVKTIYNLEKKNRIGKIETFFKIKEALRKNFKFDLFQKTGANVIWKFEDLDQEILNIVEGGLLGDGCIAKYGVYKQEAKDKKYLEWLGKIFNEKGIRYRIISKKRSDSYLKGGIYYSLYTHSCPAFSKLRREWYIENAKGRGIKRIPADIKLTSTALLHWYLGDGNFKRDNRNPPKGGRPCLRICTNGFLREDIELLLEKLRKDLGLNFYPLPKLNKNIKSGYVLHLYPADLFRFFKMIGLKPPREIENCITGIRNEKLYTFKGKWPNRIDLIRILAKTRGIGKLLKERRKELGLTQREVAEKIGIKKHHVSQIECGRKFLSLNCFNKFLQILKLKEDFMAIQIIKAIPEVLHL